jgi:CubicO group peptidase (beta-lactamase class C family)
VTVVRALDYAVRNAHQTHWETPAMSHVPSTPDDARAAGLTEHGVARMSRVLQREIANKRVPGAVAMVGRGGRVGYFQAHGRLTPEGEAPMSLDSLFRIYSMTKPIVSVAVMMLVEEGRLLISDPISKYLPEFSEMKVGVEEDGKPFRLEPAHRPITIQDLLRHTSGLTYGFVSTGEVAKRYQDAKLGHPKIDNVEVCKRLGALPLLHQPGTRWSYSQSTDVLGRLLEVAHGKPLGAVLEEVILKPLGMKDTIFEVPEAKLARLAKPLPNDPDTGAPVMMTPTQKDSGGGGLYGTVGDYGRFCQMLANGGSLDGTRILSRKMLEFATSDHLTDDMKIDQNLGLLPPGHGFGLGFAVRRATGLATFPGSTGAYHWSGIAGTTFWIDPKEDLWAVLMLQAPAQREYYRLLFRNIVYSALA